MILSRKDSEVLADQINLLVDWNKENIEKEPEQVRKNIETIILGLNR